MEWLNYHHLLYFWTVAKEGSIARASEVLRLAQPTISGQVRALEEALGEKLFKRVGRGLVLTETGQVVYTYADEIFSLGRELQDTLRGRPSGRPMRLVVGISDVVPKLIAHRILLPALGLDPPVQLVCREGKTEHLLADLAVHGVDMVLADAPIGGQARVRAYNHLLGECGLTWFAWPARADALRAGFPQSLEGEPVLLPTDNTLMRRSIDHWLDLVGVRPQVVAEFEDSALLKVFGEHGAGAFAAPSAIEAEIQAEYGVRVVGRCEGVTERFYAISVERKVKHPAVAVICDQARGTLFAGG